MQRSAISAFTRVFGALISAFTRVFGALISAFTRVFDALWRCAADPGSILCKCEVGPGSAAHCDLTMLRIAGRTLHRVRDTDFETYFALARAIPSRIN
jgi:hypothetical protein